MAGRARPSVFARLGQKGARARAKAAGKAKQQAAGPRATSGPHRVASAVVVRGELAWELENADADALEKRREQLKRELDLHQRLDKKPPASTSSSSRSSSSTSVSSSTSGSATSSSSSARETRKKIRKIKSKRNSSSSSGSDRAPKKKHSKEELAKRDKSIICKKNASKKEIVSKKHEVTAVKKKIVPKSSNTKKSISPTKKTSGTPPINNKNIPKGYILSKNRTRSKSPRKEKRSASPHLNKEKEKERERERIRERLKERERERDREREREKDRNKRSKSPRTKARSRSPLRRHDSHPPRDVHRKDSPAKARALSPKARGRQETVDKHRGRISPRDDRKDDKRKENKDRSLERRKDNKHEDKDRYDRDRKDREQHRLDREAQREKEREEALARCQERQRERERLKEQTKREQEVKRNPRGRDRDRGLNKGLEKPGPDKPVERLLPRPEERLAALAATNKSIGLERAISSNRDRQDPHSDRGSRKTDRGSDRDRIDRLAKRQTDRRGSVERTDRSEYGHSLDRSYDHSHSMDRSYDRPGERYDDLVNIDRDRGDLSPGAYPMVNHDRDLHYDSPYDMQGSHSRGYLEPDDRVYNDHLDDHHALDRGFIDDRRNRECGRRDDISWDGRETSVDQDRQYMHHAHPHKEWENEGYHSDWNRQDRHWQHRESQHKGHEWTDKERDMDGSWHSHRQNLIGSGKGSRGGRGVDDGNYRSRQEHSRGDSSSTHAHGSSSKRSREPAVEVIEPKKPCSVQTSSTHSGSGQPAITSLDPENPPIPDDLSEISDDADEILNRDDEMPEATESTAVTTDPPENLNSVDPYGMIDLQQFKPDYEPMIEHMPSKSSKQPKEAPSAEPKVESTTNGVTKDSSTASEGKADQSQEQHDGEDGLDNLDFEEISDGELEEDQRVKGLGDALGVDWASLVAEVRGKDDATKEKTGAREYWHPQKVLARIGVSLHMAGEPMINEIFNKTDEIGSDGIKADIDNQIENKFNLSHPIASIQVAIERRRKQRIALFGTNTGFTRALCARQDLALRRHLCNLPINESGHDIHHPDPHLFAMAQKLIQKTA